MTTYERQRRYLTRIERNVKRIGEIIADPNSCIAVQDESTRVEAIRILRNGGVNLSRSEEARRMTHA